MLHLARLTFIRLILCLPIFKATKLSLQVRGFEPDLLIQFEQGEVFVCDQGVRRLEHTRVNDDYCDCEDGSDEPGTSACSHTAATFYCGNAGYIPQLISTSLVNDNVCDCCDGSDEALLKCSNECGRYMEEFQTMKSKAYGIYDAGAKARNEIVNQGVSKRNADEKEKETLEDQRASFLVLVDQLNNRKLLEEELQEKERAEKVEGSQQDVIAKLGLLELDAEKLAVLLVELLTLKISNEANHEQLILEKIRDQRNLLGLTDIPLQQKLGKHEDTETSPKSENPGRTGTDSEEVVDSPFEKLLNQIKSSHAFVREETKLAQEKHQAALDELKQLEERIYILEQSLNANYGPQSVLYSLRDYCIEASPSHYNYKICLFGQAYQNSVSLGVMDSVNVEDDTLMQLSFTNGEHCWNGPQRSIVVTLECNPTMELLEVEEPSVCVYKAKLKSSIACDAYHLQRLKRHFQEI
ncbi:hypothetical protein ABG067_000545 [Albugo candida]